MLLQRTQSPGLRTFRTIQAGKCLQLDFTVSAEYIQFPFVAEKDIFVQMNKDPIVSILVVVVAILTSSASSSSTIHHQPSDQYKYFWNSIWTRPFLVSEKNKWKERTDEKIYV